MDETHITEFPQTTVQPDENHKQCFCCGRWYPNAQSARFSILTTNGVSRRLCGDCVTDLWHIRTWANQNDNPARPAPRWGSWGWLWPRR